MSKLKAFLKLTKPSIMLLVVVTGMTALVLEGSLLDFPGHFGLALLGLYLTGGCANALNQYFERHVDAKMQRTAHRRPLPAGLISPNAALIFSLVIGVTGIIIFVVYFNWLSAGLALATILFYSFFYTLGLKPTTPQNIVIGGTAGAMGPIIAWAAAANTVSIQAVLLFLIIFFWTPPHFWALALYYQDDYKAVGYPMMPIVAGTRATLHQMTGYSLATVAVSLVLIYWQSELLYVGIALTTGIYFLHGMYKCLRQPEPEVFMRMFKVSIVYLFGLFLGLHTAVVIN